jgi:2OG-Fe(II) oxygenase superfamily
MNPLSLLGFWLRDGALPLGLASDLCRVIDSAQGVEQINAGYQQCEKYILREDRPKDRFAETRAAIRSLWQEYLALAPHMGILSRTTNFETPFVLRYAGEDHFSMHADNWNPESSHRQVSALIYLSDADGGETLFPNQNLRIRPKENRAIFYPSFWTHPHQALPPRSGKKYVLVTWFCYPGGPTPYGSIPL